MITTVTGKYRNGGIVLDGPTPDWDEDCEVIVQNPNVANGEIDITGESPDAIAAWLAWYEELRAEPKSEEAIVELEQILSARKVELQELWKEQGRRVEGFFP